MNKKLEHDLNKEKGAYQNDYSILQQPLHTYHIVHTTVVTEQGHVNRFICREHTGDLCRIFRYVISLRLLNSLLSQQLQLFLDLVYSICTNKLSLITVTGQIVIVDIPDQIKWTDCI